MKKAELETDKMAPNQTRAMTAKEKELESIVSPLVKWLQNIKNAKLQEVSSARHWAEIKKNGLMGVSQKCKRRGRK